MGERSSNFQKLTVPWFVHLGKDEILSRLFCKQVESCFPKPNSSRKKIEIISFLIKDLKILHKILENQIQLRCRKITYRDQFRLILIPQG